MQRRWQHNGDIQHRDTVIGIVSLAWSKLSDNLHVRSIHLRLSSADIFGLKFSFKSEFFDKKINKEEKSKIAIQRRKIISLYFLVHCFLLEILSLNSET